MKTMIIAAVTLAGLVWTGSGFADESVSPEAGPDLAPLPIALPEAYHGGTPVVHYSPVLEPEDYKDRAPYFVPKGTEMISLGKPVTSSVAKPILGDLKQITDGDKQYIKKSLVELTSGLQWVQIDLEREFEVYALLLWHFHEGKRVYIDMVVKVGNDPEFKDGGTVVYNNDYDNTAGFGAGKDAEYVESYKGRLIGIPGGVKGRYVRLYSRGNSDNELNHYVEVEVFGK